MRVTFQLTPEDYRQGLLAWRNLKGWRRWLLRCSYLLMSLTIPVAAVLAYVHPDSRTLKISAMIFVFTTLWFTFMLAGPRLAARRQFRGNPSAQSPITIEPSDAGFVLHSAHVESHLSWSAFVAWAEAKCVFVILTQPRIYFPIPKRAFDTTQLAEFRGILRRNIVAK